MVYKLSYFIQTIYFDIPIFCVREATESALPKMVFARAQVYFIIRIERYFLTMADLSLLIDFLVVAANEICKYGYAY